VGLLVALLGASSKPVCLHLFNLPISGIFKGKPMNQETVDAPQEASSSVVNLIDHDKKSPTVPALQGAPGIAVSLIDPGKNPRSRFEPRAMAKLTETIRVQGLLQGILLRPSGNGRYTIVAGERRFRAYTSIFGFGEDVFILAVVREMTDAEAERYALTENVEREAMTAVEEAESAARIVGECQGDRNEAASRLGWERKHLDRRMALMYAIPEVRQALQGEAILLGHAELLAGLRKETQLQVLNGLLAANPKPTVAILKERLDKAALPFDKAIFDKTDCAQCPHNSEYQQSLFGVSVQGGHCTSKPCFEAKTETELTLRAAALKGDYQVVRIIRPGDNFTVVALQAEGARGVGTEQALACRSCKDFGAVVNGLPDKNGETYRNMCMDTTCHTGKVAARIKAEKAAEAETEKALAKAEASSAEASDVHGKSAPVNKAGTAKKAQISTEALKPVASSTPSNALKEYREKVWRLVLKRATSRLDAATSICVLIAIAGHSPREIDSDGFSKACSAASIPLKAGGGTSIGDILESALALDQNALKKALKIIPECLSSTMAIHQIVSLLKGLGVKLEEHWKVNDEFFGLLTKNEIDATCSEIGIKQVIGTKYSKLIGGKKDELVKTILSINGFQYEGRIPKQMRW
jgi:ParB family transcriptional regulator, chromosome partitioning protein